MNRIFHSERYSGKFKKKYFEGWYFRIIGEESFSFIAGKSKNKSDSHAFIQFVGETAEYFRFPLSDFSFDKKDMTIKIKDNCFSLSELMINLKNNEAEIKCNLKLDNHKKFRKSLFSPSIMGPFSYFPMSCNHAVISLHSEVSGTLEINGQQKTVQGLGYIEKDYGKSFPENYTWTHASNDFLSIVFAEAHPLTFGMKGFFCLLFYKNRQYNFSLYNLTKLKKFIADEKQAEIFLKKGRNFIEVKISNPETGRKLAAPKNGKMSEVITESLNAKMTLILNLNGVRSRFELPCAYEHVKMESGKLKVEG